VCYKEFYETLPVKFHISRDYRQCDNKVYPLHYREVKEGCYKYVSPIPGYAEELMKKGSLLSQRWFRMYNQIQVVEALEDLYRRENIYVKNEDGEYKCGYPRYYSKAVKKAKDVFDRIEISVFEEGRVDDRIGGDVDKFRWLCAFIRRHIERSIPLLKGKTLSWVELGGYVGVSLIII
jgi:hypothetical protein